MDIRRHNRAAWDSEVRRGNPWTVPVGPEVIAAAREGRWGILLTPTKAVPMDWFPPLEGAEVLCLASGGGQQGPVLAAGARVTVLDNSPMQLEQDRRVAERESLAIRLVEGDMRDLSVFADEAFDLIVHPVSNVFVPDSLPVWREAYRVLRSGGALLSGVTNPVRYLFDEEEAERTGVLEVRHAIPYADDRDLPPETMARYLKETLPLEYGHTLQDLVGGQIDAGFVLAGFYEDAYPEGEADPISRHIATFLATRAVKA